MGKFWESLKERFESTMEPNPEIAEKNEKWLKGADSLRDIIFSDLGNIVLCSTLGGAGLIVFKSGEHFLGSIVASAIIGIIICLISLAFLAFNLSVTFAKLTPFVRGSRSRFLWIIPALLVYTYTCFILYVIAMRMQVNAI